MKGVNKLTILALLIAIVLSACGTDLQPELDALQVEYSASVSEVEELEATVSEQSSKLSEQTTQLSELTAELESASARAEQMEGARDTLNERVADLRSQASDLDKELNDLKDFTLCNLRQVDIDYRSNATVSNSLKEVVGNLDGTVQTATWDVIWNNDTAAIHNLSAEFLWVYLVTFDNDDLNKVNAVYDVSDQCYLDQPNR